MRINHNLASINTHRQMTQNTDASSKSLEKLSSGLRINRAGDDAAGLAISEKMRAQIRGLDQASRNAQDGISLIQTAEGALNETHSILQRMREIADQSANGTNTADDRKALQDEIKQLKSEIDRIGNTTEFNTQKLLNGNLKGAAGTVGQNSTLGAQVAKLTAAAVSGASAMSGTNVADSNFVKETLNIDGTDIDVNWQNLSTEEQNIIKAGTATGASTSASNAAKDLIINKINEAIDASGKNVAHVSGYVKSTGEMVLQSGSQGTGSVIQSKTAGSIVDTVVDTNAATGNSGTSKYNSTTVASGTKISFSINGVTLQSVGLSKAIDSSLSMESGAAVLEKALNSGIAKYNSGAGAKNVGDVGHINSIKVNATADGRFEIVSETGPINLFDVAGGTAVKDLGLSQAQTEAGGNGGMTFQIGANRGQTITFGIGDMRSAALGINGIDVSTATSAQSALTSLDSAIKNVSSQRSALGAVQNRLEHTINNLSTASENLTAAESRIRDVDMAKEMMTFQKNNILSQAAQAMLAQANQQPQGVLQLLR